MPQRARRASLPPLRPQGYGIYNFTTGIPGRNADPQPIIFAYIALNLQTLSQSGLIQPQGAPGAEGEADPPHANGAGEEGGEGPPAPAANGTAGGALSEGQKLEVKARLKDIMSRLMQRDQSGAAMQELHQLRR